MRRPRSLFLSPFLILALILAACGGASDPGWTLAPTGDPTLTPAETDSPTNGEPTEPPSNGADLRVVAMNIAYDVLELTAPAGQPFTIEFENDDAGIPHNVEILDSAGSSVFMGSLVTGVATVTYEVPALSAGTYTFRCTPHPIPAMTGTLTVE